MRRLTAGSPPACAAKPRRSGDWSEAELAEFLKTGRNDKSVVFGGMSDVVEHSLQYLSDDDITAIARYLKSLPPRGKQTPAPVEDSVAKDLWKGNDSKTGAALYVDNCAACHRTDGVGYKRAFPSLKGNPVVQTEDATSLIHIVLTGSTTPAVKDAVSNLTMPSFGWRRTTSRWRMWSISSAPAGATTRRRSAPAMWRRCVRRPRRTMRRR